MDKPRVALVMKGDPTHPGSWSGVPAGLAAGMISIGIEVIPINVEIPRGTAIAGRLGMNWVEEAASRWFSLGAGFLGGIHLRRAQGLDGIVAIGSGYRLSTNFPIVTFEDMTVSQALRQSDPAFRALSKRAARRWRDRQGRTYATSRACCVASNWAAASIRDDYGITPEKVHVVGFGRNVEIDLPERNWEVPRFLWVGANWERKRGEATLAALRAVRETFPKATLDLVGAHPVVEEPGVVGHGRLALGSPQGQEEYLNLLRRSTCFVMPSQYEPLGIAYIDAATAGIPSIGSTIGGSVDAIGEGGLVVDPGDDDQLVRAMLEMSDPEIAEERGLRARAHAELFTWQKVAERVIGAVAPAGLNTSELEPDIPAR